MPSPTDPLRRLAESFNVETGYEDDHGHHQESTPEAVMAVLRVLGAPIIRMEDAGDALRERRQALGRRTLEPVAVAWDGRPVEVALRFPGRAVSGKVEWHLELESGEVHSGSRSLGELAIVETAEVEGVAYAVCRLSLPGPLPFGYHRLELSLPGQTASCLILSAPTRAYDAGPDQPSKTWGVFLPLYAVRSARDWGAGDFTDLENLIHWVQSLGGGLVGTLPMLAAFLDEPFDPSPYAPASRFFWNELYLDVARAPELERCPTAREFLVSAEFARERDALRAAPLVEYRRLMTLKRRVLVELARTFFAEPAGRGDVFQRFLAENPRAEDYARFRAAGERRRATWWVWPGPMRQGTLAEGDFDEENRRYHLYVQWLADEQMRELSEKTRAAGPGLYLDYPLGVNSDSYDVWRERSSFALGVSGGAPPDAFFSKGQDWGFPPLHPENQRVQGYRYFRDCVRHHFRYAGMLRLDHLMGLHRLYWVPASMGARQGVYVRYPAEELYAVLVIESHRHHAILVGEDLGTVPEEVRPAMERHNVHRLYVVQYEARPKPDRPIPPVYSGAVASLNTHDMPTFTAFWNERDVEDRQALGLLDEVAAQEERARRAAIREALVRLLRRGGWLSDTADTAAVLRAILSHLATEPSRVVLANLEDFWQATEPQNVPGTTFERPNWRRKAKHALEEFDRLPEVGDALRALNREIREAAREKKTEHPCHKAEAT